VLGVLEGSGVRASLLQVLDVERALLCVESGRPIGVAYRWGPRVDVQRLQDCFATSLDTKAS